MMDKFDFSALMLPISGMLTAIAVFMFFAVSLVKSADKRRFWREKEFQNSEIELEPKKKETNLLKTINLTMSRAGLNMNYDTFLVISLATGIGVAVIATIVFGDMTVFGSIGLVIGAIAPYLYIKGLVNKRESLMRKQFAESLESIANFMRAGSSLQNALERSVKNMMSPLKEEFELIIADTKRNMSPAQAVKKAAIERVPMPEFNIFAMSLNIHQDIGGNASHTFENLAEQIKEKASLTETIKASMSETSATSWIVGIAPFCIFLLLKAMNGEMVDNALASPAGRIAYIIAFGLAISGMFVVRWMGDITRDIKEITTDKGEEEGKKKEVGSDGKYKA